MDNTYPREGIGICLPALAFEHDNILPILGNTMGLKLNIGRIYHQYIIFNFLRFNIIQAFDV